MCAYQESSTPPPRIVDATIAAKSRSTDSILSRNRHGHHALKKFHDQQFGLGTDGGTSTPPRRTSSSPRNLSPLGRPSTPEIVSTQSRPLSRAGTPASERGGSGSKGHSSKQSHRRRRLHFANSPQQQEGHDSAAELASDSMAGEFSPSNAFAKQNRKRHPRRRRGSWDLGSPLLAASQANRHFLSRDNKSLQNLSSLDRLIDDRTGYYEEKRATEEFLDEVGKRKNGSAIRAYYERMNETLDQWREVDEVLDSRFPEEVMLRFGSVEEVERFNGQRKRLPWMDFYLDDDTDGTESGYQEESEDSDDGDRILAKRRQSGLARAASAISLFWFGSQTPSKSRSRSSTFIRDEETGLLSAHGDTSTEQQGQRTGSTRRYGAFASAGTGLSTIDDDHDRSALVDEPTSASEDVSEPTKTPVSRSGVEREASATQSVAAVRSTSPSGQNPTALENGVMAAKLEREGSRASRRRPRYRRRSREDSGTESDDEESQSQSEPIVAGKLDAKLAAEHEERQARSKHRQATVPGTNGEATVVKDRSQSSGKSPATERQTAKPGGLSERERMRLLQYVPGRQEREGERERGAQFAININLAVNVLLLAGKTIAVFSSNSVSLIASLVDSALDLLSTVIIFGTSKAISYRSFHTYFKYPVGKKRFEPLGVVIFAVLMIASFCQVLVESVERLAAVVRSGSDVPSETSDLPLLGIAFMVMTIIIKSFMWIIYRNSPSSGVRAVAQDAENDVIFNIASLIFPVIGSKLGWPALDPIGGICLSIYIIIEWLETLTETVTKLSGAVGSAQDLSRALYLAIRFRSVISVSAMEVYHAGDDMIVEGDIVLPHGLALKEAHDLGEIITYCTESLTQVERAYIHLDYNPLGQSGHITGRG